MMRVSPSPTELFERLAAEEKIAIDLIQQCLGEQCLGEQRLGDALGKERDEQLCALVPVESRRGYLRTLAMQLSTCVGSTTMDAEAETWTRARASAIEASATRMRDRAVVAARDAARDLAWLEALPPEARRAVQRQRRRRARRAGR